MHPGWLVSPSLSPLVGVGELPASKALQGDGATPAPRRWRLPPIEETSNTCQTKDSSSLTEEAESTFQATVGEKNATVPGSF